MTRDEIVAGAIAAIQKGSKSFRAASRLFDPTTRERASLLYCWCRHCDDVCDGQVYGFGSVPRGNVSILRGNTRKVVAGEEVAELPFQALRQLLAECPIPDCLLEDHLRGFGLDEVNWQPATEDELILYCYYVAGAVGCMMALLMGVSADDEDTIERAADLGIAFQLSNIARDIAEDLAAGRCYLPLDWLEEFGVEREDLLDPRHAAALGTMVDRLVDTVAIYEKSARVGAARLPFRSRVAVLSALRIYGAIGRKVRKRVARDGHAAWRQRIAIGKMRKLGFVIPSFAEALSAGLR